MDADHIGAIVLAVVAALMLFVGVACVLVGGRPERPKPPESSGESSVSDQDESDWTDADRYHGSRQWGR